MNLSIPLPHCTELFSPNNVICDFEWETKSERLQVFTQRYDKIRLSDFSISPGIQHKDTHSTNMVILWAWWMLSKMAGQK